MKLIIINALILTVQISVFPHAENNYLTPKNCSPAPEYTATLSPDDPQKITPSLITCLCKDPVVMSTFVAAQYAYNYLTHNASKIVSKKLKSQSLAYAPFTHEEYSYFNQLTHHEWKQYLSKTNYGNDIFTQWSLYQFPGFQTYIESLPNFKQEFLKIGGFEYYDPKSHCNDRYQRVRQEWCQQLQSLSPDVAEKVYNFIHYKQVAISQGRDETVICGFLPPGSHSQAQQDSWTFKEPHSTEQLQHTNQEYLEQLEILQENLSHQQVLYETTPHCFNNERQQFGLQLTEALQDLTDGDYYITTVKYTISAESKDMLNTLNLNALTFTTCTGSIVQQQKHAEIIFLTDKFSSLHQQTRLQPLSETMVGFIDSARESIHENNILASCEITDFCWNILEYVTACGAGIGDGLMNVADTIIHPTATIENIGSALSKASRFLAQIVGDVVEYSIELEDNGDLVIELTYPSKEFEDLVRKCSKISKALDCIYNDLTYRSGPERARLCTALGTEFFVSGKVYRLLRRGAGRLFTQALSKLEQFVQHLKQGIPFEQLIPFTDVEIALASETNSLLGKSIKKLNKLVHQGTEAILKNGYYEVNGFKFTENYYIRLWNNGRKAPSLIAKSILEHATEIILDPQGYDGFYKYISDGWYMIYNPVTKIVSHLEPLKKIKGL